VKPGEINKDGMGFSVIDHSGAPIVVLDLQGRIVLFNRASEKLTGYRFAELEGQFFWEMLSVAKEVDSIRESEIPALVNEIQRGAVRKTYCWQDKAGQNHFVEWIITPLLGDTGKVENIILTGLDETDHHRSDLELARSEKRYRDIVETSQEGIWTIDANSNTSFVNPKMAEILGYSVEEMQGKALFYFMDEQGRKIAERNVERRKAGIKEQHEFKFRHKNGAEIWVTLKTTPLLDEQGDYAGALAMVTDITEHKRAEEKLAHVQRMLEQANDVARMGAWEFSPESNELVYSDILKQILDVDPDYQATPESGFSFYKEGEDRDKIQRILENAIAKGTPWDEEFKISTAKGKEKWIRTMGNAVFADNTCQRLFGSVQDITERKIAEQEFERIFELSLDIIGTGNLQGYFTKVNSSVTRILGYEAEEFCARPFLEFIHPEDVEKTLAKLQAAQNGIQDIFVENRYICKDGSIKWIEWNVLAVIDENKFYATGRDYTERKLIGDALLESELWMKNIYNSLDEAVLVVSPDRNLINVNQAALNIFGYTREEIMASSTELFHVDREHYLEFGEIISKAFSEDKAANFEFVAKRKNGEIFPSEHTVSLLKDPDGNIKGIVSVVRDITERNNARIELDKYRKHLEDMVAERTLELRDAQDELVRKERLAALGQLAATVSHELRNPLSAMRPSIYVVKKLVGSSADEKLMHSIEHLDRVVSRCDHIIGELLDFTRIPELNKRSTPIDQWLDSVIEEQLGMDNINLLKKFSLEDVEVFIDPDHLQRAVINVIENARQAMQVPESGSSAIADARLTIETGIEAGRVKISVTDTGPGIPEHVLPKIFEPLFSTKKSGVGLGLPTVQQIMAQHGGGVEIRTREGQGTTVTLWFPAEDSG